MIYVRQTGTNRRRRLLLAFVLSLGERRVCGAMFAFILACTAAHGVRGRLEPRKQSMMPVAPSW